MFAHNNSKKRKILITGNMGYIGSVLVEYLRQVYKDIYIIGYDMGYFTKMFINTSILPENYVDVQFFGDIREFDRNILKEVDTVVNLAAIPNDPVTTRNDKNTYEINYQAGIQLAQLAKNAGVRNFIFPSSCSIYGTNDNKACDERSPLNPLTAYAKSKVYSEKKLKELATEDFLVTCLRIATGCGMSTRMRMELLVNNFVASALVSRKIHIMGEGNDWRPFIHVKDIIRAIDWAIHRSSENLNRYIVVNIGSNDWNLQIQCLAEAVAKIIKGTRIHINKTNRIDKRSYKVSFDLFKILAPKHQPEFQLFETIEDLKVGFTSVGFSGNNLDASSFVRLKMLNSLQENKLLNNTLKWAFKLHYD